MDDATFQRTFNLLQLSLDMTRATDLTPAGVTALLDNKLLLDEITHGEFKDALEEMQAELESQTNELLVEQGLTGSEIGQLASRLSGDQARLLHLKNIETAKELVLRLRDEHDVDENDEALVDACNLVLYMARIRIQRDAVPLITRGLYSGQVTEAIEFWKKHRHSEEGKQEGLWQQELGRRPAILSRVLGGQVVLMGMQQHVGSAGLSGSGARITDYLFRHNITRNVTLVEIKTPSTPLLGSKYRGTYPLSHDLSGSVSQVLLQRSELAKEFFAKRSKSKENFDVAAATCVIVAGSVDPEIADDEEKAGAFEMQRDALSRVRIVTFDELYDQFATFHNVQPAN